MDWQSMDTAPRDGTPIQVDVPGDRSDLIVAWNTIYDGERDSGAWMLVEDQEPPDNWDDGVCWNDSTKPVRWKSLPAINN